MDLEFQQLDRRYEALRKRSPRREARLLASLAELGQQVPVVVVADGVGDGHVLVDGYKRVRALVRLRRDTVRATVWDLAEAEALLEAPEVAGGGEPQHGALPEILIAALRNRNVELIAHPRLDAFDHTAFSLERVVLRNH